MGRTFTGPVGFVDTEMYWVQNHMVAPKEMALTCTDCHMLDGRIQFAELGYPTERARALQNRYFKVDQAQPSGADAVKLDWMGAAGFSYQVQYTTDLEVSPVQWVNAEQGSFTVDPAEPEPVALQWTETQGGGLRFYRVIRTDDLQ